MSGGRYVISGWTGLPFEEVVGRARSLLTEAGYGVLCEIDVAGKFREKLGMEHEPYVILGACNPPLASEALGAEPDLGALLPCNLAVYRRDGRTVVAAIEPETMLSVVGNGRLDPIARRVREDFERIVGELTGSREV